MIYPDNVELQELQEELNNGMNEWLTDREKRIVELRYGVGDNEVHTLKEVGKIFDLHIETVRMYQNRALRKLGLHGVGNDWK